MTNTEPTPADLEKVAKAIEGPHFPVPADSKYTLEYLRDHRWNNVMTEQERERRRTQARAAIAALSTEREKIVAWIRRTSGDERYLKAAEYLADAIERGEHWGLRP